MKAERNEVKFAFGILISFSLVLFFFPIFAAGQEININISVSALVSSTSTVPAPYCGDGICNSGETCATCSQDCGNCGGGGGGGGTYIPPETEIVFLGKAYPLALLTILRNGAVIANFKAEQSGLFERRIKGIAPGTYNFSVFAEDSDGRKSVTIGFTAGVLSERITTISGIFISPTIDLGPTQVERGGLVNILGQAFPESQINIFIASNEIVKETFTTKQGKWKYELNTIVLEESEHTARASAIYGEGEQSPFSQTVSFLVVKKGALVCKGADLNFDNKINLTDFSILLYYWGQKNPQNLCTDINQDGNVNLVDFSIMMYYWTK